MCSRSLAKSLKNETVEKFFSAKFQVKIAKCKTFRIFTDSTKAYYNSDNPKNIFRIRLVRNGFYLCCVKYADQGIVDEH